ncbi:MAG TPA: UxaA family hydrolase, partial [Thermomicrobiales bacterium]|nr:UxaA family hydrolase [Thermomicrobiales bacterium]
MAIEIGSRDAVKGSVPFNDVAIILDPSDVVGIAKRPLLPGTVLVRENGVELRIAQMIPPGHKFALVDIANDAPVRRYGQIIGFATAD